MIKRLEERTDHFFHLINRKQDLTLEYLADLNPRYVFFPHWSHIISESVFEKYECVVFHMTDLPYGRGGSPLQNLIQLGYDETMMSALRCEYGLDSGPIYMKRRMSLNGAASEIYLRAANLVEQMIEDILLNEPAPLAQTGEPVVFRRRTPAESELSTANVESMEDFFDFIRMLDAEGYPRAFIRMHGHRIELSHVQMHEGRLIGDFIITPDA